ncbi:MAG: 4-hydroxybutyrate CoA-transferase [Clostridiales Family XIII bacterium]|jgi:4-hydroxybutyrate CoA-transferase|nr:4-hydroxybutyrate CoA-transferase [Clostridiales Family XIII bacterium]
MQDWREYYNERLTTAEEAVKHIPNNSDLWLAHAVGEPPTLTKAMIDNYEQYENVRVHHMVRLGPVDYTLEGMEGHFIENPMFSGANNRAALADGRADYSPVYLHEAPKMLREGDLNCDVLIVQVSPPDEAGYVSFGVSCDYTVQANISAKITIAQVNPNMPRTWGETQVPVTNFEYFVEAEDDLYEIQPPKIDETAKLIGEHCASLVEDGSTLQLGIGAIPDAVCLFLKDKKHLGIHSEMIADGTLELVKAGVIDNSMKSVDKDRLSVTFLMGTRALYDWADDNPALIMRPSNYINHPAVVMQQYKMVCINSAIEVDMMGQVASEAMGLKQFSGPGGQVDFVRGASMAEGGKSIIAMPSVTIKRDGTIISKIVPFLQPGAAVTTTRNDVHYVVTEYGIAPLKGKSLRQRAKNLINIAHPDCKQPLIDEYEKRFGEKY